MNNLKRLLSQPLQPVKTSTVIFVLVLALIGFSDATYLTIEHYKGVIPPCTVLNGCEAVLSSVYSSFFGIPVALFGSIYYLLVLIGVFAYLESKNEKLLRYALFTTVFGFGASLWFVFLQIFVIHSFCLYCMLSATTSTILFGTAITVFLKNKK